MVLLVAALLAAGAGCARLRPAPTPAGEPQVVEFEATAYCITGTTASGMQTRPGIVAADPAVLPLGSRIRVDGAGPYSGE
jgi:3D (Asp-Asp-Asp) domain-containing protein